MTHDEFLSLQPGQRIKLHPSGKIAIVRKAEVIEGIGHIIWLKTIALYVFPEIAEILPPPRRL